MAAGGSGHTRQLSTSGQSLYELLGLTKGAGEGDVKSAYRKLALKCHPDKNPDNDQAAEQFKLLNHANRVLMDPTKRRIYDKYGSVGLYMAEQVGEERVDAYMLANSGLCKALIIIFGILTGCYCCFCCCCCCGCCCGKCNRAEASEESGYDNLEDLENEADSDVITSQPK